MTIDAMLALAAIAVTMTWTPGPNNVMLTASGATFGLARTFPHAMGVAFGFPVMLFLVAMGLGGLFETYPLIADVLSWVGFAAMLWFSWKIATARTDDAPSDHPTASRPLTLWQAAAFQWVNPKAWTFAVWITASYASGGDAIVAILVAALIFLCSGLGSSMAWTAFGAMIGRVLGNGTRMQVFNVAMAMLLLGSAVWLMLTR